MSHKYIEKSFLYLILLSAVAHLAAFALLTLLPPEPQKIPKDVTMIELKDLPEPLPAEKPKPRTVQKPKPLPKPKPVAKQEPKPKPEPKPVPMARVLPRTPSLKSERAMPQARNDAVPKAENKTERLEQSRSAANVAGRTESNKQPAPPSVKSGGLLPPPDKGVKEASRGEGLLKPQRGDKSELAKLFPSAKTMESMEESYRKKYRNAEQGDTRMIDTDDPLIAVYSNRLLIAANNSLQLQSHKRVVRETGVGVLQVTIKRDGSIEEVTMIESTRSKALDDLAVNSVLSSSYVGPLPKKWPHEKLNLIWIFSSRASLGP